MSRPFFFTGFVILVVSQKCGLPRACWCTKCLDFHSDIPYGLPWVPKCLPQWNLFSWQSREPWWVHATHFLLFKDGLGFFLLFWQVSVNRCLEVQGAMWCLCRGAVREDGLPFPFPREQMSFAVFCRPSYLNPIGTWHLCLMAKPLPTSAWALGHPNRWP